MPKRTPEIRVEGAVAYVELTQDLVATVDIADVALVAGHTWHAKRGRNTWHAATNSKDRGPMLRMHRLLLGVTNPKVLVDHRDGNGLNNTRENLRIATNQQNLQNSRARGVGYKGVTLAPQGYNAQLMLNGEHLHLGTYLTAEDAAAAYDTAAREQFGEFALTNFAEPRAIPQYLTSTELARTLGISVAAVKRRSDKGLIPFLTTPGGHRRFPHLPHQEPAMSEQTTSETTTTKPVAYLIRRKEGGDPRKVQQHVTLDEAEANILGLDDDYVVHPLGYQVPDISGLSIAATVGRVAEMLTHVVIVGTTPTTAMDDIDAAGTDVLGPYNQEQAEAVAEVLRARFADGLGEYEEPYGNPFVEVKQILAAPTPDEPNWIGQGGIAIGLKLHAIADNWVERES